MSSHINQCLKTWNQDVINQMFGQDIAMTILRIPLIEQVEDEKLI
jgi:hypothetical protein